MNAKDFVPHSEDDGEVKILRRGLMYFQKLIISFLLNISTLIMGKQWKQCQTLFLGAPKSLQMVTAAMKLKDAYSLEGKL